jgi:hypothetical protein
MRHVVIIFAAVFILLTPCFSQDGSTGSFRGIVLDPSNGRIPGATVALVNISTAFHYQQTSDAEGRFAFDLLPPGDYSARVTAEKMSPQLSRAHAGIHLSARIIQVQPCGSRADSSPGMDGNWNLPPSRSIYSIGSTAAFN